MLKPGAGKAEAKVVAALRASYVRLGMDEE